MPGQDIHLVRVTGAQFRSQFAFEPADQAVVRRDLWWYKATDPPRIDGLHPNVMGPAFFIHFQESEFSQQGQDIDRGVNRHETVVTHHEKDRFILDAALLGRIAYQADLSIDGFQGLVALRCVRPMKMLDMVQMDQMHAQEIRLMATNDLGRKGAGHPVDRRGRFGIGKRKKIERAGLVLQFIE